MPQQSCMGVAGMRGGGGVVVDQGGGMRGTLAGMVATGSKDAGAHTATEGTNAGSGQHDAREWHVQESQLRLPMRQAAASTMATTAGLMPQRMAVMAGKWPKTR